MWQDALEALEDPRAAVLLTSIDFSKAFNRLDFKNCLTTPRDKGATSGVIKVISSFLTNRRMMVKVGSVLSEPKNALGGAPQGSILGGIPQRSILGGVPQGSILGVYLFNCSIDSFEASSNDVQLYPCGTGTPDLVEGGEEDLPVPDEPVEPDYRHLTPFLRIPLEIYKYVDDNVILEKLSFDTVTPDGQCVRTKWAVRTENILKPVVHQAMAQGMKINCSKTKTLLISELKSYLTAAFFKDNLGGLVKAGEYMNILGIHFSTELTSERNLSLGYGVLGTLVG